MATQNTHARVPSAWRKAIEDVMRTARDADADDVESTIPRYRCARSGARALRRAAATAEAASRHDRQALSDADACTARAEDRMREAESRVAELERELQHAMAHADFARRAVGDAEAEASAKRRQAADVAASAARAAAASREADVECKGMLHRIRVAQRKVKQYDGSTADERLESFVAEWARKRAARAAWLQAYPSFRQHCKRVDCCASRCDKCWAFASTSAESRSWQLAREVV